VLARGGRLGGFSGGPDADTALDTKTWLLRHEGALAARPDSRQANLF
jgi:O6-methylguanine-DNA--protein-cysteine methyltransferase